MDILIALLIVAVVFAGAVVGLAAALARRSRAPLAAGMTPAAGMPIDAPADWAGAHTPEARLHRRLCFLAWTLAAVPLGDATAIERRSTAAERIRRLDRRLIDMAGAPESARRPAVAAMQPDVEAIEAEVGALATEPPLR